MSQLSLKHSCCYQQLLSSPCFSGLFCHFSLHTCLLENEKKKHSGCPSNPTALNFRLQIRFVQNHFANRCYACAPHAPKQTGAGSSFGALQVVNKPFLQAACWQQICYWHVYLFIYLSIYLSILLQVLGSQCGKKNKGTKKVNCPWTVIGVQGNSLVAFQSKPLHHCFLSFFFFSFGADVVQGLLGGRNTRSPCSMGETRGRESARTAALAAQSVLNTHKTSDFVRNKTEFWFDNLHSCRSIQCLN